jgi:hypothetical protein
LGFGGAAGAPAAAGGFGGGGVAGFAGGGGAGGLGGVAGASGPLLDFGSSPGTAGTGGVAFAGGGGAGGLGGVAEASGPLLDFGSSPGAGGTGGVAFAGGCCSGSAGFSLFGFSFSSATYQLLYPKFFGWQESSRRATKTRNSNTCVTASQRAIWPRSGTLLLCIRAPRPIAAHIRIAANPSFSAASRNAMSSQVKTFPRGSRPIHTRADAICRESAARRG